MNWLQKVMVKAAGLPLPGRQTLYFPRGLPDERDYARIVGDGTNNSIVAACIQFIIRAFPEAPPAMWREDEEGVRERVVAHPMVQLVRRPNPFYSGRRLWAGTITSFHADGNAYWLKVRNAYGAVIQLWYIPHWLIEPKWPQDGSVFIQYYEYRTPNGTIKLPPSEVVHFRYGLDPENTRKGRSPLYAVLREVFTDEEAARFSASVVKNMGVPGVMISPVPMSTGMSFKSGSVDTEAIKTKFIETFSGDHRGEPFVASAPMDIKPFTWTPAQLDLSALRDVAEERVTASLGLPAAVVGFGTGLQQTKVGATMAQLREQAWEGCLIPTQSDLSEDVWTQLMPDFEPHPEQYEFGFDLSRVRALQEDQGKLAQRWAVLFLGGLAKRKEARAAFDLISDDDVDDVYAQDIGIPLSARGAPIPPKPGAPAPTDGAAPAESDDSGASLDELAQQIDDLQQQVDDLGGGKANRSVSPFKAQLDALTTAIRELKARKELPTNITVNVPEREVNIDNTVNVPERTTQIDASTTIAPGAVVVNNEASSGDVEITRDANGNVTGAHRA